MLNLDDPKSQIIFKASSYIDKIKRLCATYPLQDFDKRQETFLQGQIICEEFAAFCRINFDNADAMISVINSVNKEMERLQNINIVTEPGRCKLCNGTLSSYKSSVKEFGITYNCDTCSTLIYKLTNDLEMYSGAWMI
jgi:hypothetical protein